MIQTIEDIIWDQVTVVSKMTNCQKRKVGCVIYNTKLSKIVGHGYNTHLDGVCDCHSTRTAQHAEDTALKSLKENYPREDLILFVDHAPCPNCKSLIETNVFEVRYRSQK